MHKQWVGSRSNKDKIINKKQVVFRLQIEKLCCYIRGVWEMDIYISGFCKIVFLHYAKVNFELAMIGAFKMNKDTYQQNSDNCISPSLKI